MDIAAVKFAVVELADSGLYIPMKNRLKNVMFVSALSLIGCGGGGDGGSAGAPSGNSPVLTVSTSSLTFSGKQFGDLVPAQRINLTYDRDVVNIVSMTINGDAKFEGRNIFSLSSDSSNSFADIRVDNSDIEGGTYIDQLVLEPILRAGGTGDTITVDLTLVQEATEPVTAEITDPADRSVQIVEGGPPVRVTGSVFAGNTIRWEVQPYRFSADSVDAVTTDPIQGTGSQEVDVVITPTPTLVESIRSGGSEFAIFGFQDRDHPGNFTQLDIEITLAE